MVWEVGVRRLIIEIDSLKVFHWVKGVEDVASTHANVVYECKEWLKRGWIASLQFVFREGNQATDSMAKLALGM